MKHEPWNPSKYLLNGNDIYKDAYVIDAYNLNQFLTIKDLIQLLELHASRVCLTVNLAIFEMMED